MKMAVGLEVRTPNAPGAALEDVFVWSGLGTDASSIKAWLDQADRERRDPFDDQVKNALGQLSKWLLNPINHDRNAAFLALGFWLRPAAISKQEVEFRSRCPKTCVTVARGIAFHLPPANVESLFVYSLALSLLCGNVNICRLPSTITPATNLLLDALKNILIENDLGGTVLFVSYPRHSSLTAQFSAVCDLRIVWGGDEKIRDVGLLPTKPRCLTVSFADRFSYSAINSKAYDALASHERDAIAAKAYNDIFLFDQLGCSSTHLQYWVGDAGASMFLARDFNSRVAQVARRQGYQLEGQAAEKYGRALSQIIETSPRRVWVDDLFLVQLEFDQLIAPTHLRGRGGSVAIFTVDGLQQISEFVSSKDQTLTVFGFSQDEMVSFARDLKGRGIDRIVPIGSALSFDQVWDGQDLLVSFSKSVSVRT